MIINLPVDIISLMERLNRLADGITKLWVGADKPSHSSTWERGEFPEGFPGWWVPGDTEAYSPRKYHTPAFLRITNRWFGWQKVVTLEPHKYNPEVKERRLEYWNYAWSPEDHQFFEKCRVKIPPNQKIRVLVGPNPFYVYGVGSDSLEVPILVSPHISRHSPQVSQYPLL